MTNLQIDLLQEALVITLRDKYAMPTNFQDIQKKYLLVEETWKMLESMRKEATL